MIAVLAQFCDDEDLLAMMQINVRIERRIVAKIRFI